MSSINSAALFNALNGSLNNVNTQSAQTNTANANATPDLSALYSSLAALGTNGNGDAFTNSAASAAAPTQPNLSQIMLLMVEMLKALIGTLGANNQTPAPPIDPKQQAFNRIDQNGDGVISREEFQNAPPPPRHAHRNQGAHANLQRLLANADTNKDGTISQAEFNAFVPTTPSGQTLPAVTAEKKQAMFALLDQNGDGAISQTEIQNAPPPRFQNNNNAFLTSQVQTNN